MSSSDVDASGAPFQSLQERDATVTRRTYKTCIIVVSTLASAGLAAFCFWPAPTEPLFGAARFPEPTSLAHANELLLDLPPTEHEEELYSSLVLTHLPVMYRLFLESYGSTAPQIQQTRGTSLPVHALDEEEFNNRLEMFGANVKRIIKMNSHTSGHGPDRAIFAINIFADWSKEELDGLTKVKYFIPPHPPSRLRRALNASTLVEKVGASCDDVQSMSNCAMWRKRGFCAASSKYHAYMVKNCKLGCGLCPTTTMTTTPKIVVTCKDVKSASQCEYWQKLGYCSSNSKFHPFMVTNCKDSCFLCPSCKDEVDAKYCVTWKKRGYCGKASKFHKYMGTNCQKTCGLCDQVPRCDMKDCWSALPGKYLAGYASFGAQCFDEITAMEKCAKDAKCHGVNKQFDQCGGTKWTLRAGKVGIDASKNGYDASKLESRVLDRTCLTRFNNHCDDNDGTSRNWAAEYEAAFQVRSQGGCGSCWAHSTSEMLRQHWTIKHIGSKDVGLLSVQWMIDCVQPYASSKRCKDGVGGCCGGWPHRALTVIHERGGLPTQAAYPYLGQNHFQYHTCNRQVTPTVTTLGPKYSHGEYAMKATLIQDGSLGITLYATPIHHYAGGVFPASACGKTGINHAVQLVGYIDEKKAWLIQNSWGSNWGVSRHPPYTHVPGKSGFVLLQYGENTCNIAQVDAASPKGVDHAQAAQVLAAMPAPPQDEAIAMSNDTYLAQPERLVMEQPPLPSEAVVLE